MSTGAVMLEYSAFRRYAGNIIKADKHVDGMIALAAAQYCKPFTDSNGLGYLISLPYGLEFNWNGGLDIEQKIYGINKTDLRESLEAASFDDEKLKIVDISFDFGCLVIQLLTGLVVATPKNFWLMIVPATNENRTRPEPLVQSAILETDWWRGELQININIRLQNHRVIIPPNSPIAKLILIPKELIDFNKNDPSCLENGDLIREWQSWHCDQANLGRSAYRQTSKNHSESHKVCPMSERIENGDY